MEAKQEVIVEVMAGDEDEMQDLASEMKELFSCDVEITPAPREVPEVTTRSVADVALIVGVVKVVIDVVQTAFKLADFFNKKTKKSIGTSFVLTNPVTGEKVTIRASDSLNQVKKKVNAALGPSPGK